MLRTHLGNINETKTLIIINNNNKDQNIKN